MFYVGQRVCAIVSDHPFAPFPRIKRGDVLTIAEIFQSEDYGDDMLQFVELKFGGDDDLEPGFRANAFRPVVERKTSIETFTAMLNPSDKRVKA